MRAFILEDDPTFAKVVEIRLKSWRPQLELKFASTIAEAKAFLDGEPEKFDFAIIDQHLPDGLGYQLASHPAFNETTVLAVSSDDAPELPGQTVLAGAQHFLGKRQVTTPLFIPLLEALVERRLLESKLRASELSAAKMKTIRTLIATLRHEINNPLGAVIGATYLLRQGAELDSKQREALTLIDSSSGRIKNILEQLCDAAELEEVLKAQEEVFQIPGDAHWPKK